MIHNLGGVPQLLSLNKEETGERNSQILDHFNEKKEIIEVTCDPRLGAFRQFIILYEYIFYNFIF